MIRKPNFKLNWKYAIGELVLIFLGISLAISFQNLNANLKLKSQEQTILESLLTDFELDSAKLKRFVFLTDLKMQKGRQIKNSLWIEKTMPIDSVDMVTHLFFNGRTVEYSPFIPTYDELVASGRIDLLSNKVIKNRIVNFMSRLSLNQSFFYNESSHRKQEYNDHLSDFFNAEIMALIWRNPPDSDQDSTFTEMKKLGIDINGFRKHPKSKIMVQNAVATDDEANLRYERFLEEIHEILELIRTEIND